MKGLETEGVLDKTQCEKLLQTENTYERMDQLLNILAVQDNETYKSFINVLEANDLITAAKFLKKSGRENFPNLFFDEDDGIDSFHVVGKSVFYYCDTVTKPSIMLLFYYVFFT